MWPSAFLHGVGVPEELSFAAQYPACPSPCQCFAAALAGDCAWLGAGVGRYSFTVRLLHSQHLAGLTRRTEDRSMAAYLVGRLSMRDPSWRTEYGPKTAELVIKHGGRFLVRGAAPERLEGNTPMPSAVVVLEFPSMAQAKAFYNDPAYAPLIKLRQSGSDLDLVAVEGV
jgi:uncharacterized protein (DUF1330 family)